jgi:isohexenylglutaconyl-CoA hydratase
MDKVESHLMSERYLTLLLKIAPPFAYLTLNRPAQHNALNAQMVDELLAAFTTLRPRSDVSAVVLSGAGGNFCGDMDRQTPSLESLSTLLQTINQAPQVVVAKIDGEALNAGFGLVCVSDIAIASTTASFGMPQIRRGVVPDAIVPFVIQRIGLTRARLLMLTGTVFDGVSAHEYGVVHELCPREILDDCTDAILNELRQSTPAALAACKQKLFGTTN